MNVINDLSYREQLSPYQDLYSYALNNSRALDPKDYYTQKYTPYNIFNEIDNAYRKSYTANLRLQAQLSWKITPKVDASVMGAIRYQSYIRNTDRTEK